MVYFVLFVLFVISGFMLGFGDNGRGSASQKISTLAGLVWLGGVIYAFTRLGVGYGLLALAISFLIANISMRAGKMVVLRLRGVSKENANPFQNHNSAKRAVPVKSVAEEYEYLRSILDGYEYKVIGVETNEIEQKTYDILTVEDLSSNKVYKFFFDATVALAHGSENLDAMLRERKEKDRKAVVGMLESIGCKDSMDVWEESLNLTEQSYDLLKDRNELTTELLQEKFHIRYDIASAIMYRFHFRGWIDEDGRLKG